MSDYASFLASKRRSAPTSGRTIEPGELHPSLHKFQRDIVTDAEMSAPALLALDEVAAS